MNSKVVLFAFCISCISTTKAQCIIPVTIEQHPPLTVVASDVQVELPSEGLVIGGDVAIEGGDGEYTYIWTNGEGEEIGSEATILVTEADDYYLQVTDGQECSVSVKFSVVATGIKDVVWDEIKQVRILSTKGYVVKIIRKVYSSDLLNAYLRDIPHGIYLIEYIYENGTGQIKRFIIK